MGRGPGPVVAALAFAVVLALPGCGDGTPAPRPRRAPAAEGIRGRPDDGTGLASLAAEAAYGEADAPFPAGTVAGRVTLRGPAEDPVYEPWPAMGTDRPTPSGRVVVGEGAGLADVVVWVRGVTEGKPWPAAFAAEDRRCRLVAEAGRLRPFLSVVRVGTQLELENRLPGDWTVHGYAGTGFARTRFNVAVAPAAVLTDAAELFLDEVGVTFVTEDRRAAFEGYVVAFPHPYVEVTSAVARGDVPAGGFRIDRVPEGSYDVLAWHPGLGMRTARSGTGPRYVPSPPVEQVARVRVRAGAAVDVAFEFEVSAEAGDAGR